MQFSRGLYAKRSKRNLRPIESNLIVFDLNTDSVVTRLEMRLALKPYLQDAEHKRVGSGSALP